jgi:hypothetical protein
MPRWGPATSGRRPDTPRLNATHQEEHCDAVHSDTGGAERAGGAGNVGNTGLGNGGLANTGVANSGPTATGGIGAAFVTGSAPNAMQGSATGWSGSVSNFSGSAQPFTVWVLCAS